MNANDNHIEFGTLNRDGSISNIRALTRSQIAACPHFIMDPGHYKEDGTCLCFDKDEQERILAEKRLRREKFIKLHGRKS